MVDFTKLAAEIYRDYVTDGVPLSGKFNPIKSQIRTWGLELEGGVRGQQFENRADAEGATVPAIVQTITVLHGYLALKYARDVTGTALVTGGGATWSPIDVVYPEHFKENTAPGTTDMTAAFQAALDFSAAAGIVMRGAGTTYAISDEVRLAQGSRFFGQGNWSGASSLDKTTGTTVLKWIGASTPDGCMVNISRGDFGVEITAGGGASQMQNVTFTQVTLDGNQLVGYGVYCQKAFSQNCLDFITVTGTMKHAFWAGKCFGGTIRNWCAFRNLGAGITLGRNTFGWTQANCDQSTLISFFGYYSGHNASAVTQNIFDESGNEDKEYGIGIGDSRSLVLINAQANECSGAGFYLEPATGALKIYGAYSEACGKSSNATRAWVMWFESNSDSRSFEIHGMHTGLTDPAVRLTGTASSYRDQYPTFRGCRLPIIYDADWINYRVIDGSTSDVFANKRFTPVNGQPVTYTLADDTAIAIVPPTSGGFGNIVYYSAGQTVPANNALFAYDVGASSPDMQKLGTTIGSSVAVGTTALAGTTGTDARLNLAGVNDGNIYIENRLGGTRDFVVTFLGG